MDRLIIIYILFIILVVIVTVQNRLYLSLYKGSTEGMKNLGILFFVQTGIFSCISFPYSSLHLSLFLYVTDSGFEV
jgi:hypothetical protein